MKVITVRTTEFDPAAATGGSAAIETATAVPDTGAPKVEGIAVDPLGRQLMVTDSDNHLHPFRPDGGGFALLGSRKQNVSTSLGGRYCTIIQWT